MHGLPRAIAVVALAAICLAGCASGSDGDGGAEASASPAATATGQSQHSGRVEIGDGVSVAYRCTGEGSPAVILEAGSDSAGTTAFPSALITPIADVTTVCTYDRLGTGASSRPPDEPRGWDELGGVLDELLTALELEPPYVIAGQSGGGNTAIEYAARHPERVAGLVLIEAYHDDPAKMAAWQAEEGFTWEDNPEHFDVVQASAEQDGHTMPIGDFPVVVVSATQADPGGPENQAYWLGLSPDSRQVVIEGPHDLHMTAPQEIADEFLALLQGLAN